MSWPSGTYDVTALLPVKFGVATRLSIRCGVCGWHDVDKMTESELTVRLSEHWVLAHQMGGTTTGKAGV